MSDSITPSTEEAATSAVVLDSTSDQKTEQSASKPLKRKPAKPAAVADAAPQDAAPQKVENLVFLEALAAKRLPDYQVKVVGKGDEAVLLIGPDSRVAIDCKVTQKGGQLVAHFYGFIKPADRERISLVLSESAIRINETGVFLHRNGR